MIKYPNAINFIATLLLKYPEDLDSELKDRFETLQEKSYSILYGNIDLTLFREDIDPEKAFDLVKWAIHGYEDDLKYRLRGQVISTLDYDIFYKEFYDYLDVLRKAFHKSEEDSN